MTFPQGKLKSCSLIESRNVLSSSYSVFLLICSPSDLCKATDIYEKFRVYIQEVIEYESEISRLQYYTSDRHIPTSKRIIYGASKYEPIAQLLKDIYCPMVKLTAILDSQRIYRISPKSVFISSSEQRIKARSMIYFLYIGQYHCASDSG